MFTEVRFHSGFETGSHNTDDHVDAPHLSPTERKYLDEFVDSVLDGLDLDGKNKDSFSNSKGYAIKAEIYKRHDVWHFHAGPYHRMGTQKTSHLLPVNLNGSISDPVVHYVKDVTRGIITIIGFSRVHDPFPDPNSRKNPLRYRASVPDKG